MKKFNLVNFNGNQKDIDISYLDKNNAKKVINFHKSFPQYKKTPLIELKDLSKEIGLKNFYVKDESYRFDLNAFKILGGSYAIGSYIVEILGKDISELSYEKLVSDDIRKKIGDIVFVTATDGNHGRGIAWTANQLKQKSKVFMPKGSSIERLNNIKAENSDAAILDYNYDDCVRLASKYAEENKGILVQDTSWEGYEKIPKLIMQGYITLAYETYQDLKVKNELPTHIFIQAGVGALASSITGFFANVMKDNLPVIIIIEPNKANCLYRTALANDGKLHNATGNMDSIMAGLCCGEPITIGWGILAKYAKYFISVDDIYAAHGMRLLGNPLKEDKKIVSGESGAVTSGVVHKLMTDKNLEKYKKEIGLDENSIVLCFSTEGDTDKERYRKIVWNGEYQNL